MKVLTVLKILLDFVSNVQWSFLIFFIIFYFRRTITVLLQEAGKMVSRVNHIRWKDLSIIVTNSTTPEDVKVMLTTEFVLQEKVGHLNCLSQLIFSLRALLANMKYSHIRLSKDKINDVVKNLTIVKNLLQVRSPDKAQLLQQVIHKLLEVGSRSIDEQISPVCEAFDLLDSQYREKDPENFQELMNIRSILID